MSFFLVFFSGLWILPSVKAVYNVSQPQKKLYMWLLQFSCCRETFSASLQGEFLAPINHLDFTMPQLWLGGVSSRTGRGKAEGNQIVQAGPSNPENPVQFSYPITPTELKV